MNEPTQGTPSLAEQPATGTQPQEQAPQQTGQPQQAATPTPQPTVEQLQQQLEAERQQRTHFEQQYQALQPEYTRARQALASLTGANAPASAPADPLAPYIKDIVAQGYNEKDARVIAGTQYRMVQDMVAPLQQQAQVGQQMSQVDYMLTQAAQFDQSLFANQQAYDQARTTALQFVQQGGQLNPGLIVDMAAVANYHAQRANPQRPQFTPSPQPTALPPQPFANGQFRVSPGFSPQQQLSQQLTAEQKAAEDVIKNRFPNHKP